MLDRRGMATIAAVLYLSLLVCVKGDGATNGFFSFATRSLAVDEEFVQPQFTIQRTGGDQGQVLVQCKINSTHAADFFPNPGANLQPLVTFENGDRSKTCQFTVYDDDVPEGNETYSVHLSILQGGGNLTEPKVAQLTVMTNDGGSGKIGFSSNVQVIAREPSVAGVIVPIKMLRLIGTFGDVGVKWKITDGPNSGVDDFVQTSGQVAFANGQSEAFLNLQIKLDNLPENDESFTLTLESPSGGASLNTSFQQLSVLIPANDAPIRFPVLHIFATENMSSVNVEVYRGLAEDGFTQLGPSTEQAYVGYYLVPGNAMPGKDYQNRNGTLVFGAGERKKFISINLVDDPMPELSENFSVYLANASTNTYVVPPSVAMVTILASDDHHGVIHFGKYPKHLDEDGTRSGVFNVNRTAGNYGTVMVSWKVQGGNATVLSDTFDGSTSGILQFLEGESSKSFNLNVKADLIPEQAQEFAISLSNVTGGARLSNIAEERQAVFFVLDSDDVYGVVTLANKDQQRLSMRSSPRQLLLRILRRGGTVGELSVSYNVGYYLPGAERPAPGVTLTYTTPAIIPAGQSDVNVTVTISDNQFIKTGSVFRVELSSVSLSGVTPVVPAKTPKLGSRFVQYVNVTAEDANGDCGFSNSDDVITHEPSGADPTYVRLLLIRDGTLGTAVVSWVIESSSVTFNSSDVDKMNGQVEFKNGENEANLTIAINPDDVPEVDETFKVKLVNITSPNRLQTGVDEKNIVIKESDNPGGTFEFGNNSDRAVKEGDTVEATIVRLGSALDKRIVGWRVFPNQQNDIDTSSNIIIFEKDERSKRIQMYIKSENVPELAETFTVELYSVNISGIRGGTMGSKTTFSVTVAENDDPHGVFGFDGHLVIHINESHRTKEIAHFSVVREKGAFGDVDVYWNSSGVNTSSEIYPISGVLNFNNGEKMKTIDIESRADELPEKNEAFSIHLIRVTGSARLGEKTLATLVIDKNDDPVFFTQSAVRVSEGQYVNLTVERGGDGDSVVTVMVSTQDGTAVAGSDYDAMSEYLTFGRGVFRQEISLRVINDSTPEGVESFSVTLVNVTGNAVFLGTTLVTVTIDSSDGATGVFEFVAGAGNKTISEGSSTSFPVSRSISIFGVVDVYWKVLRMYSNGSTVPLLPGQEFTAVTGSVRFGDQVNFNSITLTAKADSIAELNEAFVLQLVNATGINTGEDGKLGKETQAMFEVITNDDPNGRFMFAVSSRSVYIPEDYNPGMKNETEKNLTVLRGQGHWGKVEVLWEIFTTPSAVSFPSVYDLLFLGTPHAGATLADNKRRVNTGTYVFQFTNGRSDSYVEVSSNMVVGSEFSISAWIQPSKNTFGFVLSKIFNTQVFYGLAINTTAAKTVVKFVYLMQGLTHTLEAEMDKDLADGSWHNVAVTIGKSAVSSSAVANFYEDGSPSGGERPLNGSGSITDRSGMLLVGTLRPNYNHFDGYLQDVRIYSLKLESSVVEDMTGTINTLTPINGYLTFDPGVWSQQLSVATLDDSDPEAEKPFVLALLSPKGGATLDKGHAKATLIVEKSDNANGLFGFKSVLPISTPESTNITVVVERQKGIVGKVTVTWAIYEGVTSQIATQDFITPSGSLIFKESESEKTLEIALNDDTKPELSEHFVLKLLSASSEDGKVGSTPTSGASLRLGFTAVNITIENSDHPYGLLQFVSDVPSVNDNINILSRPFNIGVNESDGSVILNIVRAQGTQGLITVQWRTVSESATSPRDYQGSAGKVTFQPGARNATIPVVIKDNNIPELEKTFRVELYSPTGGAAVGAGGIAMVTILPSDDAFGVISFANNSLSATLDEAPGSQVVLRIQRTGGALGPVRVEWRATGPDVHDLVNYTGYQDFSTGQNITTLVVKVKDDVIPEPSESYIIRLMSVSAGRLSPHHTESNITIRSSDDPFGIFQFNPSSLRTSEGNLTVNLTIARTFGTMGTVRVFFTSENISYSGSVIRAKASRDYQPISGSVDFTHGQKEATIGLRIYDDAIPEDDELVLLELTKVVLIYHPVIQPVPENSPRLGHNKKAKIVIEKNDDANGILQLSASAVTVQEPNIGPILNVTRMEGAFGQVNVFFVVTPGTAMSSDYQVQAQNVSLAPGQRFATVPVNIVDDRVPEFRETFTVRLLAANLQGGATLGSPVVCTVTIEENDYPYGLIGFGSGSLDKKVVEATGGAPTKVSLTVERRFGRQDATTIHWEARLNGQLATDDITLYQGDLVFAHHESSKQIQFDVVSDNKPETAEVIQFNLTRVTQGKASINPVTRLANLTIAANDAPHGVFEFVQSRYTVIEEADSKVTVAYLPLTRKFGTFGDVRVYYSTYPGTAQPNKDYNPLKNSSVIIPEGNSAGNITVFILNDSVPELGETLGVVLEYVELIGAPTGFSPWLGDLQQANVTILLNDDAHGLFAIMAKTADQGSDGAVVTVEERENLAVELMINRLGGTIGDVSVTWQVYGGGTAARGQDFTGDGFTFDFREGERSKTFSVTIKDDEIPERDETIIIKLVNPTGGSQIAEGTGSNVTIVISANDGVGGKVGFAPLSRSVITSEGKLVNLLVNRTLPAAGQVTVGWNIVNGSADFMQGNGTVNFREGQTSANISLQIRSDSRPEVDEIFLVQLSGIKTSGIAQSGKAVLLAEESTATVSVAASDEPHGVVEFQQSSRDVQTEEANKTLQLTVSRLFGKIGSIRVHYEVMNGSTTVLAPNEQLARPGRDFTAAKGSIEILDGQSVGIIDVQILDENLAELDEVFMVNITSVELMTPISSSKLLPRLGQHLSSRILIHSNDNPKGALIFSHSRVILNESTSAYNLTVVRTQGTFGVVRVYYRAVQDTARSLDFFIAGTNAMTGAEIMLEFADGQREQNITVYVFNDDEPEDDEKFTVYLSLRADSNGATLGRPDNIEVVIAHNDYGRGVFTFDSSSTSKIIAEPGSGENNEAEFTVVRSVSRFGTVVVGWKVLNSSATSDLYPVNGNMTFGPSQTQKTFRIRALIDSVPEQAETFLISLSILSGGGTLQSPSEANLTVTENDLPYGMFEVVSSKTKTSSVSVEEDVGIVKVLVKRLGGNYGRIYVDFQTVQGTAVSPSGDVHHFEVTQQFPSINAKSWHSFGAYGDRYLVLASTNQTGPLPAGVGISSKDGYQRSTLFRWQGVYVPVQSFATDGAVAWESFMIDGMKYLAVANYGVDGSHQTTSRVYKMEKSGKVSVLQDVATEGAVDIKYFQPPGSGQSYLVIANQKNNAGTTNIKSQVYRWDGSKFIKLGSGFSTRTASGIATFQMNNKQFMAMSFYQNLDGSSRVMSPVYEWDTNEFKLIREVETRGPVGVQHFDSNGKHYLLFANSKAQATVFNWDGSAATQVQTIPTGELVSARVYQQDGNVHLLTVEGDNSLKVYKWHSQSEAFHVKMNTTVEGAVSAEPVSLDDRVSGNFTLFAVATSGLTPSPVIQPVQLSPEADFIRRRGQLIFEDGERELELDLTILPDTTPERDESFKLVLTNASGSAVVGPGSQLTVTVLSNDNAHGRVEFSANSIRKVQPELDANTVVTLTVLREQGTFGRVTVYWNATGNYSAGDITPTSGQVVFNDGVGRVDIPITVHKDDVPELDEYVYIRLVELTETGSMQPDRGAVLNTDKATALLIIPSNDEPHGLIQWHDTLVLSQEPSTHQKNITLTIQRRYGMIGGVIISYETVQAQTVTQANEVIARPGVDYMTKRGVVRIGAGEDAANITIDILHDNSTEKNKIFFVNLTSVVLDVGSKTSSSVANSPRISPDRGLTEVVIAGINFTSGELNFDTTQLNISLNAILVNESQGSLQLTVTRTGSTIGDIGFHYIVSPVTSGSYAEATAADYSPSSGTVTITDGVTSALITVNITDDVIPETQEEFFVRMTKPVNGARIGPVNRINVIIDANDEPYGKFGFWNASEINNIVQEGHKIRLDVMRTKGTFRMVTVNWKITPNPGNDISPPNGSLTFDEYVTSRFIELSAVNDSLPEGQEQFTVELVSATNGGTLDSSKNSARLYIPANDNARGVISIAASSRNVLVKESQVFHVTILRQVGRFGQATVGWSIRKDKIPNTEAARNTFNATSGSVAVVDGQEQHTVVLQVLEDNRPEEREIFSFNITSVQDADLDKMAASAVVTVAASDDPYGVLEFDPPLIRNVSEDGNNVMLTVRRKHGITGRLALNFSIESTTATAGKDYQLQGGTELLFNNNEVSKTITLTILQDTEPELSEVITVRLLEVHLIPTRVMNYSIVDGIQIDIPPRIGADSTVNVTIMENDNARGTVEFKETTKIANERDGVVVLDLERKGGVLLPVEVVFQVNNGTAYYGQDFNVSGGHVVFSPGQHQAQITLPILDDNIPEYRETFTVRLVSTTNGASLGAKNSIVVTIETSDNPQGLFGFVNETSLVVENPNVTSQFKLGVARIGGAENQIQVDWRLIRLTPDPDPLSTDFQGSTNGRLTFNAGVQTTQYITLNLLPFFAEEPEEKYLLSIYQVSGSADISDKEANITITVLKHGFPNGVFAFKSTSLQTVDEPDTGKEVSLQFTVERTRGTQGTVTVHWKVIGHTDSGAEDVRPLSDVLIFNPGEREKNVVVYVKGDDVPELEESYTVSLTSVDGGGDLDLAAQNVTFEIRANDNPHGVISLAAKFVKVRVNSDMSRQLEFKVKRDKGTIGNVIVTYQVTYSSWYPEVLNPKTVSIANGNSESLKVIQMSTAAFLSVGSQFTVALAGVSYDGSGESTDPVKLATSSTSATAVVPESAANAVFKIDESSRFVAVNSVNRVPAITVQREGMYGAATVTWRQGYPPDMLPSGYTAGRLEPTVGSLLFSAVEKNKTFSVTAVPEAVPNKKLVYAVHLESASSRFAGGANVTRTKEHRLTIIEYSGVIAMAPSSQNLVATEGSMVSLTMLRQFSVLGSVQVRYIALGSSKVLEMASGEYSKSFTVEIPNNDIPQKDSVIFVNITAVTGDHSPKLGSNLVSRITVKDNDDAHGVLSITTATPLVQEDAASGNIRKVDLDIQRSKGTIGHVTVVVRTVGGGEPWDSRASPQSLRNALANRKTYEKPVAGLDYDRLETNVSFSNQYPVSGAQTAKVQLTIRDDDIPEPSEKIFVYLSSPTGGARLATGADSLQSWTYVTIEGNDDFNGDVGFAAASRNVSVDEDTSPSVELVVERRFRVGSGASSGSVTVVWRIQEQSMRSQVKNSEGEVTMAAGVARAVIILQLINDEEPEFQSVFHVALVELKNTTQARLALNATIATVHMPPSDFPYGLIGFAQSSIYTIVNKQSATATLEIVREKGTTKENTVSFEVRQLTSESSVSGVPTYKALQGQDYVTPTATSVQFLPDVKSRTFTITLLPEKSSSSSYPKAFDIVLLEATNNAALKPSYLKASIIISNDDETTKFLKLRATAKRPILTDDEINQLLVNLTNIVKSPLNSDRLTLTKDIIELILNSKARRPTPDGKKLQAITRKAMMDIFDELLNPSRSDTKGKDELAAVFEKFAFSLVYGLPCSPNPGENVEGKYAAVEAFRKEYKDLNGLKIKTKSSKDYFEYPKDLFLVSVQTAGSSTKECQDIHYIDYKVSHWFNKPNVNPPVRGKVLSTSLNETAAMKNPMSPVTYRVYLDNKRVTPRGASCVYWDVNKGDWSTSGCEVKYDQSDFVECQCNHLTSFAIQAQTDDREGYSNYFYAACGVCMAAFALALLAHHACAVDNSFVAKLMMHMFFAGLLAHIMLIVGAFTSPSLVQQGELARCSVLGMFLQYFFLCQFSWMFIQGWNLWRILVLNDEYTNRKYILFFILGWGLPVIVVVLYIIIAQAAFNWPYTKMYGDVHGTGDMCFMSNVYAALATNVAPVLVFLMGVAVVFTQAYQVTPQWKYYDDIFRGQYNIKEIRHIIIVFTLITLTWLFAGLHLAYGFLWMIITFCILDIITGMYVFILFFILRNQVRGMFKKSYAVPSVTPPIVNQDDFFQDRPGSADHSINSVKRQRTRHSPESDWEEGELAATPGGSRKLLVDMNGHLNDSGSFHGRVNEGYVHEPESQDFDDLIYALKTGGNFDPSPDDEKDLADFELSPTSEHYQVRRISIADTHL